MGWNFWLGIDGEFSGISAVFSDKLIQLCGNLRRSKVPQVNFAGVSNNRRRSFARLMTPMALNQSSILIS
jgi:hypothetical protein